MLFINMFVFGSTLMSLCNPCVKRRERCWSRERRFRPSETNHGSFAEVCAEFACCWSYTRRYQAQKHHENRRNQQFFLQVSHSQLCFVYLSIQSPPVFPFPRRLIDFDASACLPPPAGPNPPPKFCTRFVGSKSSSMCVTHLARNLS